MTLADDLRNCRGSSRVISRLRRAASSADSSARTVTLHLARGTDSPTDVFLGQAPQPLVNSLTPGTRIALINVRGQVASLYQLP